MLSESGSHHLFTIDQAHEARYQPTRSDTWTLPANVIGLGVSIAGFVAGSPGEWLHLVAGAAFATYPLIRATQLLVRRAALRLDERGVTFGAPPPLPSRLDELVPWSDIRAVYLWRTGKGIWQTWHVGLLRTGEAGTKRPWWREITGGAVPWQVPREVSYDTRRVSGWRLDREQLAEAVRRFAPAGVSLVDVEETRR